MYYWYTMVVGMLWLGDVWDRAAWISALAACPVAWADKVPEEGEMRVACGH